MRWVCLHTSLYVCIQKTRSANWCGVISVVNTNYVLIANYDVFLCFWQIWCFVFSFQQNQISENVFEWICPKYSVTLITNSEFGHLGPKIQITINHMLPVPWQKDVKGRTLKIVFFFSNEELTRKERKEGRKKELIHTVLSFRSDLLCSSLKTCKANWFLHWFFFSKFLKYLQDLCTVFLNGTNKLVPCVYLKSEEWQRRIVKSSEKGRGTGGEG